VDWLGLALLAIGIGTLQTMLERGERHDWFTSPEIVIEGLVSASTLLGFVWHELHTEHPVVDLRILRSVQFTAGVLFGGALGLCLYATVFVLPVYLQVLQGFTANQTGMVILPGALASAFTMAATSRTRGKMDGRILVVFGVAIFMVAMWQMSRFTTASGQLDFFWPLVLRGIGLGLVFVPLTNLALADLPMEKIPNGTGLFNLMRQLGGSIGIALSATVLPRLETQNRAILAEHLTRFSAEAQARLAALSSALLARGLSPGEAETRALAILNGQVTRQAMMLSFERIFIMFGWSFALALPMLLLMRKGRGFAGGGAH
jgi:DHA2 family multidrug resistance protein